MMSQSRLEQKRQMIVRAHRLAKIVGIIIAFFGIAAIFGWVLDIPFLKSISPNLVTIKFNTALAFLFSGVALYFFSGSALSPGMKAIGRLAAGLAALIGLLTLSQYLSGWNLGIDQLFWSELPGAVATSNLGRMAPATALNFLMLGVAMLFLSKPSGIRVSQTFALLGCLIGFLGFTGYVFGVKNLYGIATYTQMAVHTAVAFVVLGFGILLAQAEHWLMQTVTSEYTGGMMARRLLPLVVIVYFVLSVPILAGWNAGLFQQEFAFALQALGSIIVFTIIIWRNARYLNQIDLGRELAQAELQKAHDNLEQQVLERTKELAKANKILQADIAERKKTSEEIRRKDELLRQTGMMAKVGGWEYDVSTGKQIWTDETYKIHDLDKEAYEPNAGREINTFTPKSKPLIDKAFWQAVKQGKPYDLELEMVTAKGNRKIVRAIGSAEREGRKIKKVFGTLQDITELKKVEELKDQFLNTTSHELKTPLIPIKSQCQLLLGGDYGELNKKQKEAVEMVSKNEVHLERLVNDILDIARGRSGKLQLAFGKSDLRKTIHDVFEGVKGLSAQKNISLHLKVTPRLPKVFIDPQRIAQAMTNLLDNAIRFTPENETVDVAVTKRKDDIEVSIHDTGIGMDKRTLKKIFTPFFQADAGFSRKHGGTGLGLSICKEIIESHGGKIWCASEGENKGSTFTFTLPLKTAKETQA